jgi:hypothetical protein
VVDLLDRHHQDVAGSGGGDGEEGHHPVVAPHEAPGDLAVDDAGEQGGHGVRPYGVEPPGETTQKDGALVSEALPRRCPVRDGGIGRKVLTT